MPIKFVRIAALLSASYLASACTHMSSKEFAQESLQLPAILDQVNQAIQIARAKNGDHLPEITSVKLDLQVGTTRSATGQVPLLFVIPELSAGKENTHKISLTFAPKDVTSPMTEEKSADAELVAAISAIYKAVANSNPGYQFKSGSIELDCTLKLGASTNPASAAKLIKLVPIEIDSNYSHQSSQTVTLVFGPEAQQAAKSPADAEPVTAPVAEPAPPVTPSPVEPPAPNRI